VEPVSDSEVKLVERIGTFFAAILSFLKTVAQVVVAMFLLIVIGLASVKMVELYNNSTLQLEAAANTSWIVKEE
jgi:hypothetical protein